MGSSRKVAVSPTVSGSVAVEIDAGARQSGTHDALEIIGANSDAFARAFERIPQLLLLRDNARISGALLVIHLSTCTSQPLRVGFLLDRLRERGRRAAIDAALCEAIGDPLLDHLSGGAELTLNHFGLAHQGLEHNVGFALLVTEITAEHLLGRLELAIDAAVALLETRRVPGQIEMDEIGAIGLKIDAFARRVGADENAQRLLRRIGIECRLHLLAAILAGGAGEYSRCGRRL